MTSTTDATLDVARGTLTLVTVSEDYQEWPGVRPDDRTFYATASTFGYGYATIVVPETDDRHRGMWALAGEPCGLELEGQHYGWNIPRNMVRPYAATPADTRPRPASADLSESDRRALPVEEAYPVGSMWEHTPMAVTVTVEGHRADWSTDDDAPRGHYVQVTTGDNGNSNPRWVRGALDSWGVFMGWADDAPTMSEADIEDGTFTRDDVDRMVREARQAAKQEEEAKVKKWTEMANARAVEYAEQNGLCSEFERCMEDIGLMGREEWHNQHDDEYRVTFTVSVVARGRDEDDAAHKARQDLYEDLSYPLDQTIEHYSTTVLD